MSHWLDEVARGLAEGRFSRRQVLRRGGGALAGGLLASVTAPLDALAGAAATCPGGKQRRPAGWKCCGSRPYDPATDVCCTHHEPSICRARESCCHDPATQTTSCYDPFSQGCCGPKAREGFVYKLTSHVCCGKDVCAKADGCCGDTCTSEFCPRDENGKPGRCCGGNICYDPATHDCCNKRVPCKKGLGCCGDHCYDPKTQECCNNKVPCKKGAECCGDHCCPPSGFGPTSCCGKGCFDPAREFCCPDKTHGCERGQECCGSRGCCNPKTQECCGGTCVPKGQCSQCKGAPELSVCKMGDGKDGFCCAGTCNPATESGRIGVCCGHKPCYGDCVDNVCHCGPTQHWVPCGCHADEKMKCCPQDAGICCNGKCCPPDQGCCCVPPGGGCNVCCPC